MVKSYRCVYFTVIIASIFLFNKSYSQNIFSLPIQVRAKLVNVETGNPVVFANIYDLNRKGGVISDTLGNFELMAHLEDTLYISCLGYNSKLLVVSDTLSIQIRIPIVGMTEKIYELGSVNIRLFGSYEEFKYKVLHAKLPENKTKKVNEQILKEIKEMPRYPLQENASVSLGSPITGLYMMFSKEGKFLRNNAKAKEEIRIQNIIQPKYNRQVIERATGLKGDMLDKFILFCQPDRDFLIKASEYEIYQMIEAYYERFKALNSNKSVNEN